MLTKIFTTLLFFLSAVWALSIPTTDITPRNNAGDKAPGPFTTSSRWILDANGDRFKMRCVHWVAHMEVNIPEGLQHQSMDHMSSWIAQNDFNCVRLSYSIDMALNPDQTVSDSFKAAAGLTGAKPEDMAALYQNVTIHNPSITASTSVIDVFDQVITSLNSHGVKTILDNHVSKASWCCNLTDGNGWFDIPGSITIPNTKYFNITNWLAGLSAMSTFSKTRPGVIGMDLRNEMRPLLRDTDNWYKYIPQGLDAIHTANPDLLLIVGGLSSAVDMSFLYDNPLDISAYPNKIVWEFHVYQWSHPELFLDDNGISCTLLNNDLGHASGFLLEQGKPYTGPLWLSEFGINTASPSNMERNWMDCVSQYVSGNDAEWSVWTLGGDYYVRSGTINYEESFGLLDPTWGDWKNKEFSSWLGEGMFGMTQGP